jgi:hypothetical protein
MWKRIFSKITFIIIDAKHLMKNAGKIKALVDKAVEEK